MSASPLTGLHQVRSAATGSDQRSAPIYRAAVYLFTVAVEAILVLGFILAILAPGADGGYGTGPDRPPAPLAAPHRP